jgi:internalin A
MLTRLDLIGHKLKRTNGLPCLPRLKHLCVAFNELLALPGLEAVPCLTCLDISHNTLTALDGLEALPGLSHLTASFNALSDTDVLNSLRRWNSQLTCLDLDMNPLTMDKMYISLATRRLPRLAVLDNATVSSRDRHCANTTGVAITSDLLQSGCMTDAVTRQSGGDASTASGLCLDHARLRRLGPITELTQLTWASFDNNELNNCSELHVFSCLTTLVCSVRFQLLQRRQSACLTRQLAYQSVSLSASPKAQLVITAPNLQNNMLTSLHGLESLTQLEHLDLAVNRLSSIDQLSHLQSLTMLSLDQNVINSLVPLSLMAGLMELYGGSNKLESLSDLQPLCALENLLILDLTNNLMCKAEDYQQYAIYRLRQLRALDGQSISAAAQATARNKFAGRLTIESLEENAGPTNWAR